MEGTRDEYATTSEYVLYSTCSSGQHMLMIVKFSRGKTFHVFSLPLQPHTQLLKVLKARSPPSTTNPEGKSPFHEEEAPSPPPSFHEGGITLAGHAAHPSWFTNQHGHLWRDKWTALSGPLSARDKLRLSAGGGLGAEASLFQRVTYERRHMM